MNVVWLIIKITLVTVLVISLDSLDYFIIYFEI